MTDTTNDTDTDKQATILIGMGRDRDVGLNQKDELLFRNGDQTINMGLLNDRAIDDLCEYLQRLKIHVPKFGFNKQ